MSLAVTTIIKALKQHERKIVGAGLALDRRWIGAVPRERIEHVEVRYDSYG